MEMKKGILKAANALVNLIVIVSLGLAGIYSAFALWDNNRIYAAAEGVQADMIKLKPEIQITEEDSGADFSELLAINRDVCGWISMDNTEIDYPILQGETNLTYINTDVYGKFALAGSIYVDSRNSRDFTNTFSLLYGHHMENSRMFGDLDLYKDEEFFNSNPTGTLILPDRAYNLEIFSCLLVKASDHMIFDPIQWQDENINELLTYIQEHAMYVHDNILNELAQSREPVQILALSTCSTEFTDARTILLTVMRPYAETEQGGK